MSAPTDLELMMLLDGELDAERRAEVEAFLAEAGEEEGADSRSKLQGMRAVSRVVASLEWPTVKEASTFDVAAAVLAALPSVDPKPAETKRAEAKQAEAKQAEAKQAEAKAPTKTSVAREPRAPASSPAPANDNSRAIFGFAIAAAAAAAALFFWGKAGDDRSTTGASPVAVTAPPVAPTPSVEEPAPQLLGDLPIGDRADLAKNDEEPRYGVEVASVDFGARSGAIYYVPGIEDAAGKSAVTTVVWLNDD